MAKKDDMKIRLLAVENIIRRGKKVTVKQILRELDSKYDISADRKTIRADIYAIDRFTPIESRPGRNGGYQMIDVLGRL
jgi:predicted DNA-binding transcriptional regulator YafY